MTATNVLKMELYEKVAETRGRECGAIIRAMGKATSLDDSTKEQLVELAYREGIEAFHWAKRAQHLVDLENAAQLLALRREQAAKAGFEEYCEQVEVDQANGVPGA